MTNHIDINQKLSNEDAYKRARPSHVTLIVQNQQGLKNLFKIVSESLVTYYYRTPRIPRSLLNEYREGLLVERHVMKVNYLQLSCKEINQK